MAAARALFPALALGLVATAFAGPVSMLPGCRSTDSHPDGTFKEGPANPSGGEPDVTLVDSVKGALVQAALRQATALAQADPSVLAAASGRLLNMVLPEQSCYNRIPAAKPGGLWRKAQYGFVLTLSFSGCGTGSPDIGCSCGVRLNTYRPDASGHQAFWAKPALECVCSKP